MLNLNITMLASCTGSFFLSAVRRIPRGADAPLLLRTACIWARGVMVRGVVVCVRGVLARGVLVRGAGAVLWLITIGVLVVQLDDVI